MRHSASRLATGRGRAATSGDADEPDRTTSCTTPRRAVRAARAIRIIYPRQASGEHHAERRVDTVFVTAHRRARRVSHARSVRFEPELEGRQPVRDDRRHRLGLHRRHPGPVEQRRRQARHCRQRPVHLPVVDCQWQRIRGGRRVAARGPDLHGHERFRHGRRQRQGRYRDVHALHVHAAAAACDLQHGQGRQLQPVSDRRWTHHIRGAQRRRDPAGPHAAGPGRLRPAAAIRRQGPSDRRGGREDPAHRGPELPGHEVSARGRTQGPHVVQRSGQRLQHQLPDQQSVQVPERRHDQRRQRDVVLLEVHAAALPRRLHPHDPQPGDAAGHGRRRLHFLLRQVGRRRRPGSGQAGHDPAADRLRCDPHVSVQLHGLGLAADRCRGRAGSGEGHDGDSRWSRPRNGSTRS